jgi:hypothetical protein
MFAAGPAGAQTTGVGPYYAMPSWNQTLPSSTRFIVLSNMGSNAVLDRETGLVWERVPSTETFAWLNALSHCLDSNTGGRTGWRLPTIQELLSLVDRSQTPALPSGHPFTVPSFFWSASTSAGSPDAAWMVGLRTFVGRPPGGVLANHKSNTTGAWCVCGGQGVDSQ